MQSGWDFGEAQGRKVGSIQFVFLAVRS
jgi:hypothetical protein